MATNENAVNSQWTPQDGPSQVTATEHDLSGVEAIVKDLEGKTEVQLRNLYAEALQEESNAKQDLYMLRQRVATLGTDVQTDEEILLKSAKQRVASGLSYLRALQLKIEGRPAAPVQQVSPQDTVDDIPPVSATAQEASVPQEPAPAAE